MKSIDIIGYNLFPRTMNPAQIIPCQLENVTAQFFVSQAESSTFITLICQSYNGAVRVDWGDGIVETHASGSIVHTYNNIGSYVISIDAKNCYSCNLFTSEKCTRLSTIPLPSIGYGMLAQAIYYEPVTYISFENLPFYDGYEISISEIPIPPTNRSVEETITIDMSSYNYLSSLSAQKCNVGTILISEENIPYLSSLNLAMNHLEGINVDVILSMYAQTLGTPAGMIVTINQDPKAYISGEGLLDKSILMDRGWNVVVDQIL